jgi:hypothetical protein
MAASWLSWSPHPPAISPHSLSGPHAQLRSMASPPTICLQDSSAVSQVFIFSLRLRAVAPFCSCSLTLGNCLAPTVPHVNDSLVRWSGSPDSVLTDSRSGSLMNRHGGEYVTEGVLCFPLHPSRPHLGVFPGEVSHELGWWWLGPSRNSPLLSTYRFHC